MAGTPLPGVFFEIDYDLKALQRVGVTRLISTTQKPIDNQLLEKYGMICEAFPIKDMGVPEFEQAVMICRYIDYNLEQEEVIAVHCRAGLGRTGTVLALYQIWKNNDALSALEIVRNIEPRWVQSEKQVKFLDQFSQYIISHSLSKKAVYKPNGKCSNAI